MVSASADCRYNFGSLHHVLFAGERFAVKYLKVLINLFSQASFYNIYGCTETNDSFLYEVPKKITEIPKQLPIGQPLPYVNYKIIDNHGEESLEGELWINSPTTMLGYWGDDQANSTGVILQEGIKYYRSSDLVRVLDDGNMLLLGRTDNVIKSSGYRINLLEIEDCLLRHSNVAEAVVVALNDEWANKKMVAVVVPQDHDKLSTITLRQHCAEIIPHYIIPNLIKIQRQRLSKTVSGKVDKQFIIEELTRGMYATNNDERYKRICSKRVPFTRGRTRSLR